MMKAEEFNDFIKHQVENNQEEPPEASWEHISESLEMETAWQGIEKDLELDKLWSSIDNRLHVYEQMLWWERTGKLIAGFVACLAVALPLFLSSATHRDLARLEQSKEAAPALLNTKKQEELVKPLSSSASAASEKSSGKKELSGLTLADDFKASQAAESSYVSGETGVGQNSSATLAIPQEAAAAKHTQGSGHIREKGLSGSSMSNSRPFTAKGNENSKNEQAGASYKAYSDAGGFSGKAALPIRLVALAASLDLKEGNVAAPSIPVLVVEQEEKVVPSKKQAGSAAQWLVGAGASARISWLMNQKTLRAMDKQSLTTALPSFHKSFFAEVEYTFRPKVSLLADLVFHSETGQRYMEYQNGVYGETNTALTYRQLNLFAAYNPRGLVQTGKGHGRLLSGVSAGLLQSAHTEGPAHKADLRNEYHNYAAAVLLGYEYTLPISKQWQFAWGLRAHVDVFNIHAGSVETPDESLHTRNTYLDFTIAFKHLLRKK